MLTRAQFPASTISLFMSVIMLRDLKEMESHLDSTSILSLNVFLHEIRCILDVISSKEFPGDLISRVYGQSLDLSAPLGDALEGRIWRPAELTAAVLLVLRAEMDRFDWDGELPASTVIAALRDLGLAQASDHSIRQAYLLATDYMPSLRGDWRLDFHTCK
jgi:hypothetical protein